jgi:hypothetical protein
VTEQDCYPSSAVGHVKEVYRRASDRQRAIIAALEEVVRAMLALPDPFTPEERQRARERRERLTGKVRRP